jgi:hypothetical protein
MKIKIILILFNLIILFSKLDAAGHYIYQKAIGNNDGTSWINAWQNFSSINWNSVLPGDTIYISGSTDSLVYTETLHVEVSGTSSNPIVITNAKDAEHLGRVIIDVYKNLVNCVYISGKDNIVINGLFLRNSADVVINIKRSQHVSINNCNIHLTSASGIDISNSQNISVSNCSISTDPVINHQSDGIYSQFNTNSIYQNNYIVISNSDPNGHNDCIQSNQDASFTACNNYLEQKNNKTSNAQGIYITEPLGADTIRIYNNVFNATESSSNGISFRVLSGNPNVKVHIIGNTVFGEYISSLYYITDTVNPIIKNNIGYTTNGSGVLRLNNNTFSNPNLIDNNIWMCRGSSTVTINSSGVSWQQWRSSGYDLHSYNINPQFNNVANNDFTLKSSSVGIDHGQSLYPPYNFDIDGVHRPRGAAWDIGTYESNFSSSVGYDNSHHITFKLSQNFPNPFNPTTKIKYRIANRGFVSINVYDVLGNEVAILVNEEKPAGEYEVEFNSHSNSSRNLTSGVYFYRLQAGDFIETKKMILMK